MSPWRCFAWLADTGGAVKGSSHLGALGPRARRNSDTLSATESALPSIIDRRCEALSFPAVETARNFLASTANWRKESEWHTKRQHCRTTTPRLNHI